MILESKMNIQWLLVLQSIFDIFLLFLVLALYRQVKKLRELPIEETIERLKAANHLCEKLSQHLLEKGSPDGSLSSTNDSEISPKGSTLKNKVFELARKGLEPPVIAQKLGLQEGEVVLLLSVGEKRRDKWTA